MTVYTLTIDGKDHHIDATGDGPVDAAFNCVKMLFPHKARLEVYQVHAVTEGTDAQAEVSVRLAQGDYSVTSRGADPDTLVASAKAYLGALNKLISKQSRSAEGGRAAGVQGDDPDHAAMARAGGVLRLDGESFDVG
mgnify:CR=1 FL=1